MNNKTHSLRPAFAEMAEDEQQKAPVSTLRPFHFLVDYENVQPADLGSFAGTDDRITGFPPNETSLRFGHGNAASRGSADAR